MQTESEGAVRTVQEIYEAFFRGDLDGVMRHCSPDATVTQDPALPWGGRYVGRDGVAAFAAGLQGTIRSVVTTEAIFEAGDRVIQHGRSAGTVNRSGAPFDVAECHVWTLRDGLVTSAEFFIDSAAMLAVLAS